MKRFRRFVIALILIAIYSVSVMGSLAPLAKRSALMTHAITGQCVGDCDICGCSPERRANHTCCCWKRELQREQAPDNIPDCCRNKEQTGTEVLASSCTCGSDTEPGLWDDDREQLPYHFCPNIPLFPEEDIAASSLKRLTDRHDAPPVPPPKLTMLS